jgi:hypothetical protein
MRVKTVDDNLIEFDNGYTISVSDDNDSTNDVYNYADFKSIEDEIMDIEFPKNLKFEYCEKYGFRFGFGIFMIFVPCYSVQNGYYDSNVTVFYNDKKVLDAVSSEET